ncbi:LCP family protein [Haloechinothrix salitolerans]|uniref:LCP family protein n=1 Tax=Haloechinothrix salitolerans TaxID=926830 RepID=A0ABW2C369_9PSEU
MRLMADMRGSRGGPAGGGRARRHQDAQMMPLPGAQRNQPPRTRAMPTPPRQPPPAPARSSRRGGQPPAPPANRKRWGFRRVASLIAIVLVALLVAMWLYLEFSINRVDALPDYEGKPVAAEGTNWLIVGSDSRAGLTPEQVKRLRSGDESAASGQRTDTIMLAHLPDNGTKPTLVSFPRDSVVDIPGHGANKINAAFAFGGPTLLARTIEQATGLRIDHYAEIGFGGFARIVDAIGGVEMTIPEKMVDTKTGVTIPKGKQELDGAQALGFVRMRHSSATPRSDLDRVVNQRKFIGALAGEMASPATFLNPFDVVPLLGAAPDALTIDEGDHLHNVVGLGWALRGISSGGTVTTTVPVTSGAATNWDPAKSEQLFTALRNDKPIPKDVIVN